MRSAVRIGLALLGGALCTACEAINDFSPFHVVGGDGGPLDALPLDLAGAADFSSTPDGAPADSATAVDAAPPDLTRDFSAASDLTLGPDLSPPADFAKPCGMTLANSGGGPFTIRFRITTMAVTRSTVVYQRIQCNNANQDFWDVRMEGNGQFRVDTGNNPVNLSSFSTTVAVNDGKPHDVVLSRSNGIISTTTDGVFSGSGASTAVYAALPPLGIAMGNPCEGADGTVALAGTVTNVCLVVGP